MIPPTGMQVESQSISSADELVLTAYAIRELGATVVDTTDIGVHAIEYVVNNFAVFPGNGKIPAIKGGRGVLDATTNIATIAAWWGGSYRGCNILGRVPNRWSCSTSIRGTAAWNACRAGKEGAATARDADNAVRARRRRSASLLSPARREAVRQASRPRNRYQDEHRVCGAGAVDPSRLR